MAISPRGQSADEILFLSDLARRDRKRREEQRKVFDKNTRKDLFGFPVKEKKRIF